MKIEISDAHSLFERLMYPQGSSQDAFFRAAAEQLEEGEAWKGERSRGDRNLSVDIALSSSITNLPFPFKIAWLNIGRKGGNFYGQINLHTGPVLLFDSLSDVIGKMYSPDWLPTDDFGRGMLVRDKSAVLTVTGLGESYELNIGCGGAAPLKLEEIDTFVSEMSGLERFANGWVNTAYNAYASKEPGKVKNPDITIYLTA